MPREMEKQFLFDFLKKNTWSTVPKLKQLTWGILFIFQRRLDSFLTEAQLYVSNQIPRLSDET
jgi:hypothetical protein